MTSEELEKRREKHSHIIVVCVFSLMSFLLGYAWGMQLGREQGIETGLVMASDNPEYAKCIADKGIIKNGKCYRP